MKEIWKDIEEFGGLYKVSNTGKVISVKNNIVLKNQKSNSGYMCVGMFKDNKNNNRFLHRLVAQAFIPNVDNKSQVNHKDLNRLNNSIENLEWVNQSENQKHSYTNSNRRSGMLGRVGVLNSTSKPVLMINSNGEIIKRYESQAEAERDTGVSSSKISMVVNGKRKMAGKHYWRSI